MRIFGDPAFRVTMDFVLVCVGFLDIRIILDDGLIGSLDFAHLRLDHQPPFFGGHLGTGQLSDYWIELMALSISSANPLADVGSNELIK